MVLPNNNTIEFDEYLAEEERLLGIIKVTSARAYGIGYDDAQEDCENTINSLENEVELLVLKIEEQDQKLKKIASHVGSALHTCKKING